MNEKCFEAINSNVLHHTTKSFHGISFSNRAVQPQKMARGLKFWVKIKKKDHTIHVAKTKVTAKLTRVFVFAYYAKSWFSHDAAHIK